MKTEFNDWLTLRVPCWMLVLVLLACACSRHSEKSKGSGTGPPVPVVVTKAIPRDVPVEIRAVGRVQAYSTVAIRPQVTGPITEVHFQEGQDVKAGDMLFSIDRRSFEAALLQARANLARDQAQMLNARLAFLRASNLFQSQIAAQADYDAAEATYHSAEGTVMADQAAVTNAEVSLSYTAIRSPIDGRTGNLTVKAGNVVKAPDDVLVTITQVRPIYVAVSVPEWHLPAVRRRADETTLPMQAFAPGETNKISRGQLTFIDNLVDTNTGTILLKGTFANTNLFLWPGQFVQASLTLDTLKQATVVPSQAVQMGQNGDFIFVVKPDSTVAMTTNLVTGISYGGETVITRGLQPGETVVIDGQLQLKPGAKVAVKAAQESPGSSNASEARP